jgi:hypothetical protein
MSSSPAGKPCSACRHAPIAAFALLMVSPSAGPAFAGSDGAAVLTVERSIWSYPLTVRKFDGAFTRPSFGSALIGSDDAYRLAPGTHVIQLASDGGLDGNIRIVQLTNVRIQMAADTRYRFHLYRRTQRVFSRTGTARPSTPSLRSLLRDRRPYSISPR